jgi:hypothetical protein
VRSSESKREGGGFHGYGTSGTESCTPGELSVEGDHIWEWRNRDGRLWKEFVTWGTIRFDLSVAQIPEGEAVTEVLNQIILSIGLGFKVQGLR